MRVSVKLFLDDPLSVDSLCVPLFEDGLATDKQLKALDKLLDGEIGRIVKGGFFTGNQGQTYSIVPYRRQAFKQLILIGLGKRANFDPDKLRKSAGLAGKKATDPKVKHVGFIIPDFKTSEIDWRLAAQASIEGIVLGGYFLDKFKSKPDNKSQPGSINLYIPTKGKINEARAGAKYGLLLSQLQNHCRDLFAFPSNILTPTEFANQARKLGRRYGFKVQVSNKAQIEKLKMGAFLSVAKGSAEPPKLVRLDYKPAGKINKRIVLVGKGITFDSGGISIKPALNMDEMKGDMGGAAVVLCVTAALAALKSNLRITTLIPTCENMPGSSAYKPGDVVTTCIGKTIEILNTDAEGRLLLAEGLGYGSKMKPDYLIDCATLTGAMITTFGYVAAGMIGTADDLFARMIKASHKTGEKIWQLPLWDEYEKQIKSSIADMKNAGGRPAGSITAARILKHFTGNIPWLHVDIAGMDIEFDGYEYMPKGSTGFGVRLLTEMLNNLD